MLYQERSIRRLAKGLTLGRLSGAMAEAARDVGAAPTAANRGSAQPFSSPGVSDALTAFGGRR